MNFETQSDIEEISILTELSYVYSYVGATHPSFYNNVWVSSECSDKTALMHSFIRSLLVALG